MSLVPAHYWRCSLDISLRGAGAVGLRLGWSLELLGYRGRRGSELGDGAEWRGRVAGDGGSRQMSCTGVWWRILGAWSWFGIQLVCWGLW